MAGSPTDILDGVITLEEFQRMPEEDAYRLELVRGRVIREPPPAEAHDWLTFELGWAIRSFAREHDLGIVVTNSSLILHVDPPTVRIPDVVFIAKESLPAGGFSMERSWRVAPDLAVEVLSPSNSAIEIQRKVLEYLECGTRLVWVVDPAARCVTIYRSRDDLRLLTEGGMLDGGDVLPGFKLSLSELFEPIAKM
jgi:Uma2 family endonuclease